MIPISIPSTLLTSLITINEIDFNKISSVLGVSNTLPLLINKRDNTQERAMELLKDIPLDIIYLLTATPMSRFVGPYYQVYLVTIKFPQAHRYKPVTKQIKIGIMEGSMLRLNHDFYLQSSVKYIWLLTR